MGLEIRKEKDRDNILIIRVRYSTRGVKSRRGEIRVVSIGSVPFNSCEFR